MAGNYKPTFLGNGYMGIRVPAAGMGYAAQPAETQAQVAGFYAYPSSPYPQDYRASIPVWSTLDFSAGGGTYGQVPQPSGCTYSNVCQAENADLTGGTSVAANHAGFTGSGFVQGYGQTGASTTFTVAAVPSDGQYTIAFRYANWPAGSGNPGSCLPRTLSVVVNGQDVTTATMDDTGSWDNWGIWQSDVQLSAGSNTIALAQMADDCGSVNIDYLTVSAPGDPLPAPQTQASGTVTNYQQTLDMRQGLLTTKLTWVSPSGTQTDLVYRVFTDRAREHVGVVRLTVTPHWSGQASVLDAFDGSDARLTSEVAKSYGDANGSISQTVQTVGRALTASESSRLELPGIEPTSQQETAASISQSIGHQVDFQVTNGHTYEITKYVGVATSQDSPDPLASAQTQASRAAGIGYPKLRAENAAAWAGLWNSRIDIAGDPALQTQVRASMFYLLESTRRGSGWSLSPTGLSSNDYGGWVFWDADTWMYPALLAQYPDIAEGMDKYRDDRLAAAVQLAKDRGNEGAEYPWQSGLTGADNITMSEIHVTADVALAQWQYYEATGNQDWLARSAWPVLQNIAAFYANIARPDSSGGYDISGIVPPDEYHPNVTDDAYTNVSGAMALQIAARAAAILGKSPDPKWTMVAKGLISTVPFDTQQNVYQEYAGYDGSTIKQADATMLEYPWQFPMPDSVAQADLNYYVPRTDTGGPAMSDAINSIDTAELGTPGCASYTYLKRSADPFMQPPFDQFSEYRGGGGAFTFTTGIGGFLQEFLYGFTGFRWNSNAVQLSPTLPPQIPGITVQNLTWHGRQFTVAIGPQVTRITLNSGAPLPVQAGGTTRTLSGHASMVVPTRRPDLAPAQDLARCQPVTASSADPSYPAVGAVDGSSVTSWLPASLPATLDVRLAQPRQVSAVQVSWGSTGCTGCSVWISADGQHWQQAATVTGTASSAQTVQFTPVQASFVRLATGSSGARPYVTEFAVRS